MKSRKHLVSRILFTMLATDETNGVALNSPGNRVAANSAAGGNGGHHTHTGAGHSGGGSGIGSLGTPSHTRTGLGPGILHSGNVRSHFHLEEEDLDQSLEEGEEYDDELEEDTDDLLYKRGKLLDSDVIPYHKKPGFSMFPPHSIAGAGLPISTTHLLYIPNRTYTFHTHIVDNSKAVVDGHPFTSSGDDLSQRKTTSMFSVTFNFTCDNIILVFIVLWVIFG